MNRNLKIVFILAAAVLLCGLVGTRVLKKPATEKKIQPSGFSMAIEEAEKKAEEERLKKEEEKKFIATYGPCRTIPILMYHHVDNPSASGRSGGWLYVQPAVFAGQMDYLVQKGYTSVTLPEITNSLITGSLLPSKPIAITFDDGYRDFHANAFSILRARNLKATVFLITQLMEGVDYLTWEQAREIAGSGTVIIGDHTLDHRLMTSMNEAELRNEIINSKQIIESRLGVTINVFAYPFGNSNNAATKILQEAGFTAAVTASRGLVCAKLPYGLSRIRIGNSSLSTYGL